MVRRLARAVIGHRARSAVLVLAVLAVAIVGALRLQIDFSSRAFYGADDPAAAQLRAFHETFGPDDNLLAVVLTSTEGPLSTAPKRKAVSALHGRLTAVEGVRRVVALPAFGPDGQDAPPPGAELRLLLSEDGSTMAVLVELEFSSDDVLRTVKVVEALRDRLESDALTAAGLRAELAGVPAIRAAFVDLTIHDQMRFVPLTALVIAVVLWVAYRRVHAVLIPAVAAGLPTLILVGTLGWVGEPVGLLNQAYFTLLPVIAVADAVHMLERFHDVVRRQPSWTIDEAVVESTSHVGRAVVMTSATTAAGFASLATADMPILRSFGLFAAVGVLAALVTSLVVVPWMLGLVRRPSIPPAPSGGFWTRIGATANSRPGLILLTAAAVSIVAAIGVTHTIVDNRLSELLEPDHPVARASAVVDDELGGILSLELVVEDAPDAPPPPLVERIRSAPQVRAVLELDRRVRPDGRVATRYSVRLPDRGGRWFAELTQPWRDVAAASNTPRMVFTGTVDMAYRGVNRITEELRVSLWGIIAVITVVLGLAFRSASIAALAVLPNVLPILVGYGTVGWVLGTMDPLAAVILTMAVGIAVDGTIHLLAHVREATQASEDLQTALVSSLRSTGRAIAITTVMVSAGLAVNLASSFPPLSLLGGLGAVVLLTALVFDLVVLPALILATERWVAWAHATSHTQSS